MAVRLFAAVIPLSFRHFLVPAALWAFATAAQAEVTLATPFRNGAVLQSGKPVLIWGMAAPAENIRVEFGAQKKETTAAADGRWMVQLDNLETNATPEELRVTGSNTVTLKNVLVGEVWLCSGQSNMNMPVNSAQDAAREIAEANHPLIRELRLNTTMADPPRLMVQSAWTACTPATVGGFSATGYFFARELHRALPVPIGIIHATLGGSPIEAWMSPAALASDPAFAPVAQRWEAMRSKVSGDGLRNEPAGLYRRFIEPLLPCAMAGFIWYQGEGNTERADEYARLLTTMIPQWRADFQQPALPFLLVQLPGWDDPRDVGGDRWPRLREAQASALALPNTGMAVALDIGDSKDLHPKNKQEVGRRLALIALAKVYGKSVEHSGPVPVAFVREGSTVRVKFEHAEGLRVVGDARQLFEIAGGDGEFVSAQIKIEAETVVVSAPGVEKPAAVRYAWENDPKTFVANDAGLLTGTFRKEVKP